jgi:hypothetical protein
MAELERLLAELIAQTAGQTAMLSISDDNPTEISKDFPYGGAVRVLLRRTPQAIQQQAGTQGLILASNPNRIGGQLVNKAANGVTLFLAAFANPAAGQVWLPPNGGTWNLRLSQMLWCGNVFAVADTGNLSIIGAET